MPQFFSRDGARGRNSRGGDKNCPNADSERSENDFSGPHLSEWLRMRLHSLKSVDSAEEFQKFMCQWGAQ